MKHWTSLKRVLRYLILYSQKNSIVSALAIQMLTGLEISMIGSPHLVMFSRSMHRPELQLRTWRSKKQGCVVLSTAEAEHVALSSAASVVMLSISTSCKFHFIHQQVNAGNMKLQ